MTDQTDEFRPRMGREGARWYNARPTPAEVAEWFSTVPLHDKMNHADYVAGISLIQTTEEVTAIIGYTGDGVAMTQRVPEIVFTPYPRVETRLAYFWNYVATLPGHRGIIEPGKLHGTPPASELPEGFFIVALPQTGGEIIYMIGRSMRVRIEDSRTYNIAEYPSEAKTVPMRLEYGAIDEHAFAKASTGAIGRALGAAGMLVLPGTGIATAEDMLAFQEGRPPRTPDPTQGAAVKATPEAVKERLAGVLAQLLQSDQRENLTDWWNARGLPDAVDLDDDQARTALARAEVLFERSSPVEVSLAPPTEAPAEPIEPVK